MMKEDLLQKLLKEKMDQRNLSLRDAASEIHVSHTTIAKVLNGGSPNIDTLLAICKWLDVSPQQIIESALPEKEALPAKLAAIISAEPQLAESFTEALQRIEDGQVEPSVLRDIVEYAIYKLDRAEQKAAPAPPVVHSIRSNE